MFNVLNATTIPSLRRFARKISDYIWFVLPEVLVIVTFVLVMLGLIKRFFFVR